MTTKIGWTDETWNPVTGCTKYSAGCNNCYAEPIALKFQKRGIPGYEKGFKVKCHPKRLKAPYTWLKPRRVFVNSMSDLFHPDVPDEFMFEVFTVMNKCPQHTFQVLTKRPERMAALNDKLLWTANLWAGVSVEALKYASRVELLAHCVDANMKYISFEPLLEDIFGDRYKTKTRYNEQVRFFSLINDHIGWVIAGGESGNNPRAMQPIWADKIRAFCEAQKIPFFFKQVGGRGPKKGGNVLRGEIFMQYPGEILSSKDKFKLEYGQEFGASEPGDKPTSRRL